MRIRALLVAIGPLIFGLAACSSDRDVDDPADVDIEVPDIGTDTDEPACSFQSDCADDEYCWDGDCREARECSGTGDWEHCQLLFEGLDEDLARRSFCDGELCRIACWTDQHCPEGDVCSDNGECIEFTGDVTGRDPGGDEAGSLRAGVGRAPLDFPIGLSLGGYGSRAATNAGRYVESIAPSRGQMHELESRAVALDDGTRRLLFVRAPLIFTSGALHEAVARRLQEETGDDWRSSLVLSATHTHSGPARFWQLPGPDETDAPLGMFGLDQYHDRVFEWLADSIAESALQALDGLEPAEMGWKIVENFDGDDAVSSDRWGESPPFDDNRILLIRIDDPEGAPRAVLTSFGTHGTIHSGPYANGDAIAGVENRLEAALGEATDRHVPVLYFNQNGGTMSPRGDDRGHEHTQRYDKIGAEVVDRTLETIQSMETTDDWSLEGHTHRFPILHDYLDYPEGSFEDEVYGGIQCTGGGDDDYQTHLEPGDYGCGLVAFHLILGHRPLSLITKSQITALQLNDLTLVTMPGELSMSLGWQVQRELDEHYDIAPGNSFTWGYAQDHLLYLLPTNLRGELPPFDGISTPQAPGEYPDYAFSYLQGGYEANMSPWGHRLGDYLVDRAVEAVGLATGEVDEPARPVPLPDEFSDRGHEDFPVETTAPADAGVVTEQPAGEVERRQPVEVAWIGGDPGAERPQAPRVTLQRLDEDDQEFRPVTLDSRRPYDNREFTMLTRLRRDDQNRPEWVVYWEEFHRFPTGTYRFEIEGRFLEQDQGESAEYRTTTDAFELVPSSSLVVDQFSFQAADELTFRLAYPAAEPLDVTSEAGDRARPTGSYRMHDRRVPSGVPHPVAADDVDELDVTLEQGGASVSVAQIETSTDGESVAGHDDVPTTRATVRLDEPLDAGDTVDLDVSARDDHDNTADISTTLEYAP